MSPKQWMIVLTGAFLILSGCVVVREERDGVKYTEVRPVAPVMIPAMSYYEPPPVVVTRPVYIGWRSYYPPPPPVIVRSYPVCQRSYRPVYVPHYRSYQRR